LASRMIVNHQPSSDSPQPAGGEDLGNAREEAASFETSRRSPPPPRCPPPSLPPPAFPYRAFLLVRYWSGFVLNERVNLRCSYGGTWKDVFGVGSVRMDPAVPLLYDALEHDAELRGPLSEMREDSTRRELKRCVVSRRGDGARRNRTMTTRRVRSRSNPRSLARSLSRSRSRDSATE